MQIKGLKVSAILLLIFLSQHGHAVDHALVDGEIAITQGVYYTLIEPAFSDHTLKIRSIYSPSGKVIDASGSLINYPIGTRITKTFYYPVANNKCPTTTEHWTVSTNIGSSVIKCPIETRVLSKQTKGWQPTVYLWEGGKPKLKPQGASINVKFNDEHFTYRIPDLNECRKCHTGALRGDNNEFMPIGPSKLIRLHNNSIKRLFPKALNGTPQKEYPPIRHYLDINCSHCHNPNGLAASSALYLDLLEQQPYHIGICKRPVASGAQSVGHFLFDITPGNYKTSALWARFNTLKSNAKMPEIAKASIDPRGKTLIEEWITQLPGDCIE